MGHYIEKCEYGFTHGQCRCPGIKTVRTVTCDNPEHAPDTALPTADDPATVWPAPPGKPYNVLVALTKEADSQDIEAGQIVGVVVRGTASLYDTLSTSVATAMDVLAEHLPRYEPSQEPEEAPSMQIAVYPSSEPLRAP